MKQHWRVYFVVLIFVGAACNASSLARGQVVLPNWRLLGGDAANSNLIVLAKHVATPVFPDMIQFDIHQGKICGILSKYPEGTTYQEVKDAVNRYHKKWQRMEQRKTVSAALDMTLWRNTDEGIAIQLTAKDGGKVELIMLPIGLGAETNKTGKERSSSNKKDSHN